MMQTSRNVDAAGSRHALQARYSQSCPLALQVKAVKGGPLYQAAHNVAGSSAGRQGVVQVVADRHQGLSTYFLGVVPEQLEGDPGVGPGTAVRPAFALSIQPPPHN